MRYLIEKIAYGFCGMPCALCPNYHTKGVSQCKGCSHDGFFTGACSIYKCCHKNNQAHCATCHDYPCKKCTALKEFKHLNTNKIWIQTASAIQNNGFETWYLDYYRKAELLSIALERYNNGKMKRYLCELFINTGLPQLEILMRKATHLSGTQKEICQKFKALATLETKK